MLVAAAVVVALVGLGFYLRACVGGASDVRLCALGFVVLIAGLGAIGAGEAHAATFTAPSCANSDGSRMTPVDCARRFRAAGYTKTFTIAYDTRANEPCRVKLMAPDAGQPVTDAHTVELLVYRTAAFTKPCTGYPEGPGYSPPPLDSDGDGLEDGQDGCPNQSDAARPRTPRTGCPDADSDGDGLYDGEDACDDAADTAHPLSPRTGCPDADTDGDGLYDQADECDAASDVGHELAPRTGCPDGDEDGDGLDDGRDECPAQSDADAQADPRTGCPLAVVEPDPAAVATGINDEPDPDAFIGGVRVVLMASVTIVAAFSGVALLRRALGV